MKRKKNLPVEKLLHQQKLVHDNQSTGMTFGSNFISIKSYAASKDRFAPVKSMHAIQKPILTSINDTNSRISLTTDAGHLFLPTSISTDFLVQLAWGLS